MKLRVGIHGASGRAGSLVLQALDEFKELTLGAAIVAKGCKSENSPAKGSVAFSSDLGSFVDCCDAWVDFTSPKGTLSLLRALKGREMPIVIATTGHTNTELDEIRELSAGNKVLLAPNTSLGVFALKEAVTLVSKLLSDGFDIEILEAHHRYKKDAPSGTAKLLSSALEKDDELRPVYDRTVTADRTDQEIGIMALRGGDIVGEHTVYFVGHGERVELTHRAWNRLIFARGALRLLGKLSELPAGLHLLNRELFLRG